jgi:hypothetical protein
VGAGAKGAALIVSALPAIPQNPANYPRLYAAARTALAQCESVDEVQEMANKAAAIAVYARQARDDSLVIMAQRIQARAIRRSGELLAEIPAGHFRREDATRTSVARAAGMSVVQQRQAAAVAQIPARKFERLVESAQPPKPYKLAAIGTRKRTRQTEQRLRRALELAEEQVLRLKARLVNAIEKAEALRRRLGEFSREQTE